MVLERSPRGALPVVAAAVRLMLGWIFVFGRVEGGASQDRRALAVLEEAGARYRSVQSFCARFEQTLEVPLLQETTRSRGTLCQAHPNLFAMRFTDPPGDVVVSDGEAFWVYYPSVDRVQVLRFELEHPPGGLDFYREFLEEPAAKYHLAFEGEETVGARRTYVVTARPRGEAAFQAAKIWLDAERSLILRARIEMENGSVRTVTLSDFRLDPPPDPQRFRFVPPPGTQVIRRAPRP